MSAACAKRGRFFLRRNIQTVVNNLATTKEKQFSWGSLLPLLCLRVHLTEEEMASNVCVGGEGWGDPKVAGSAR